MPIPTLFDAASPVVVATPATVRLFNVDIPTVAFDYQQEFQQHYLLSVP